MSMNRSFPYYKSFGIDLSGFGCRVCKLSFDNVQAMQDHIAESTHRQLSQKEFERLSTGAQVAENLKRSLQEFELKKRRINRLGHSRWRRHILAECSCMEDGTCRFPNELLMRYEMKERISLLELAAWKVACIYHQDELQREGSVRPLSNWLSAKYFVEHGWKDYRTEMRQSNRISIIVESVVPFLVESNA